MKRRKVVVLGAGGLVAQRLQQRLLHHPWFELAAVAGSARYLHQPLRSVPWGLEEPRPEFPNIIVEDISDASTIESMVQKGITVAFSALPSQKAKTIEPMWSAAGIAVFSNASAFRGVAGIPLVVPEINAGELEKPLFHACATNCTLLPLLLPCAALHASFGLAAYTMRSEQGLSGGGFDYMNDALTKGQVDASIPGEAEKTEQEFRHVLGWKGRANLDCGRVMRPDGHHVFVTATLEETVTETDVVASNGMTQRSRMPRLSPTSLEKSPSCAIKVRPACTATKADSTSAFELTGFLRSSSTSHQRLINSSSDMHLLEASAVSEVTANPGDAW